MLDKAMNYEHLVPNGNLNETALQTVWQQFHDLHTAEYGHAFTENPVELVTLRVTGDWTHA